MRLKFMVYVFMLFPGLVLAQAAVESKVEYVRVDKNGLGLVSFMLPNGGQPATCGQSYSSGLAFDARESGGKAMLATALAAKAAGSIVIAYGTGSCDLYSGSIEDADSISQR